MESEIIWATTALGILIIFINYVIKFHRKEKIDYERQKEAEALGLNRPLTQFPFIDEYRCVGCGSCVAACPEGDVLGVVFGKARVINGLRCVGHGYCENACPVGGIKVGLGDVKTRPDIPVLNAYNETNVPGIFIAGELGGFSLIRNAIAQGRMVIEKIAQDSLRSINEEIKDVIIIGAGPAGLSAALSCIQHNLSYLILDQQDPGGTILQYPRRKLVLIQPVEIPLYGKLKKTEYTKEELLEIWRKIINRFQIQIHTNTKVLDIQKPNGYFQHITANVVYKSRYVVLAMGRRGSPRKLGVPGEDRPKVMYQLIDAQSYTNQEILVVGGGDSAVEAAIGLARQKGNRVAISYRKPRFYRIKNKNQIRIDALIKSKKIKPIFNSNVIEIKDKSVVLKVDEGEMEIPNDYIFIFIGGTPPFNMLKKIGIAFGGEVHSNG